MWSVGRRLSTSTAPCSAAQRPSSPPPPHHPDAMRMLQRCQTMRMQLLRRCTRQWHCVPMRRCGGASQCSAGASLWWLAVPAHLLWLRAMALTAGAWRRDATWRMELNMTTDDDARTHGRRTDGRTTGRRRTAAHTQRNNRTTHSARRVWINRNGSTKNTLNTNEYELEAYGL